MILTEQIIKQASKLVDVLHATDHTGENVIEKELALIKVSVQEETRTAILRSKAESQGLAVPSEVIDFVATKVHSNIRELEGALNRVVALARLLEARLTVEMAASALEAILTHADSLTVDQILQAVSKHYDVDIAVLKGRNRSRSVALARHVAMYLLREELHCSLLQIGEILGGRDHTTVIYGCDKVTVGIEEDDQLRKDVVTIKEQLFESHVSVGH